MEITTPLLLGAYGADIRSSENLYFHVEKEYCSNPFDFNEWSIVHHSSNVFTTILTCCDSCQFNYTDEKLSPVYHMEERVAYLYDKLLDVYQRTNPTEYKRLKDDPDNITIQDLEHLYLGAWIIVYDNNELQWNMDNMAHFFSTPQKILFLFKKNDIYYSMYPKNTENIRQKYKHLIPQLPRAFKNNLVFTNYPKDYNAKNLWRTIVQKYLRHPLRATEWVMHKVPSGPNSLLHCFIIFEQHFHRAFPVSLANNELSSSSSQEKKSRSRPSPIVHYRNVLSHHYTLLDDIENAERVQDPRNPITRKDFQILTSRSFLWSFFYEYTGPRYFLDGKRFGYWNYFDRTNYNFLPIGVVFILELEESKGNVLLVPKNIIEELKGLLPSNLSENYRKEESNQDKKSSSQEKKASSPPKRKRCPKGTKLDKETNECIDKNILDARKLKEKEDKKKEKEEKKKEKEDKKKKKELKKKEKTNYEKFKKIFSKRK